MTAVDLDDYDFALPPEQIAQHATKERDASRLMIVDPRKPANFTHVAFSQICDWLAPGDLLVVNTTRVVPARLRGRKDSGGSAEALVLGALEGDGEFRALVRCGGRQRVGLRFEFGDDAESIGAELTKIGAAGEVVLRFDRGVSPYAVGEAPLPPYIRRDAGSSDDPDGKSRVEYDKERYQTVFARELGAVAAPTAGLHFTKPLLAALESAGVERAEVVLHVGPGTFRPIDANDVARHTLHAERFVLPEATAAAIARTRERGGRVVAVGTTTARVLESRAEVGGTVRAGEGMSELFLQPGDPFHVVDGLLTNFHLPRSSLLLLVAAFAGRRPILSAYAEAVRRGYRFYSYGDAMLITSRAD